MWPELFARRLGPAPSFSEANARDHADECALSESLYPGMLLTTDAYVAWDSWGFPGQEYESGIDGFAAPPFGKNDLARVSTAALFTADELQKVIQEADSVQAWKDDALGKDFSTRSLCSYAAVTSLPQTKEWMNSRALPLLNGAIKKAYPEALAKASLRLKLARLVKYEAGAGIAELNMHRDGPLLTATIALNGLGEYEGGGTVFEALGDEISTTRDPRPESVIRLEAGAVLLYPGFVRHGGAAVTRGLRYILVMFLIDAKNVDDERHYVGRAKHLIDDALGLDGAGGRERAAKAAGSEAHKRALLADALEECSLALEVGADARGEAAHSYLGLALLELGLPEEALEALKGAVRLTPRSAHSLALLARAHAELGMTNEALEAATRASLADPGSVAAHNNRGLLLADSGNQEEALKAFQAALAIYDSAEIRTNAAVARASLGDYTAAEGDFLRALRLEPSHQRAQTNLDLLRTAAGKTASSS